ncbi:hypothetical protein M9Y10_000593 [Tritrichomonas musculus]|uniref:Uncharacterized protein n=1 Tax=Tritrichomonas musculus TaxID=1915356 RepID=A0ABR2L7S1_9EUKA
MKGLNVTNIDNFIFGTEEEDKTEKEYSHQSKKWPLEHFGVADLWKSFDQTAFSECFLLKHVVFNPPYSLMNTSKSDFEKCKSLIDIIMLFFY